MGTEVVRLTLISNEGNNAVENMDTPAQAEHQKRGREVKEQLTLSD